MLAGVIAAVRLCCAAWCLPCSAAELARLRAGAHGQPWARLLPQGGPRASPQGGPTSAPPPGAAAVDFYDIQGHAALEVGTLNPDSATLHPSVGGSLQGSAAASSIVCCGATCMNDASGGTQEPNWPMQPAAAGLHAVTAIKSFGCDTVLVHVAICKARHGAKAKRLPSVPGCGHLRLPFAMPLFFAAPPTAPSHAAAAAPAASAPAPAVSAPAMSALAAAALRARPQQAAKPPAASAGAAGGSSRAGHPGAAREDTLERASPTLGPQQQFGVVSGPGTGDSAQLTAPPQQSAALLNCRPIGNELPPAPSAVRGSSTADVMAQTPGQAIPPAQPQPSAATRQQPAMRPAAAVATAGALPSPAAGTTALPLEPAAAGVFANKAAAAAPLEAGLPAAAAASAVVQSAAAAAALELDAPAQAAGTAAEGAVRARQAAQEPPGAAAKSCGSVPAAGLGSAASAEGSRAEQQLDAAPAAGPLNPTAAHVQQLVDRDASVRVRVGNKAAADAESTAAVTAQDPASPAFAFGSDFVQLPESPVVR